MVARVRQHERGVLVVQRGPRPIPEPEDVQGLVQHPAVSLHTFLNQADRVLPVLSAHLDRVVQIADPLESDARLGAQPLNPPACRLPDRVQADPECGRRRDRVLHRHMPNRHPRQILATDRTHSRPRRRPEPEPRHPRQLRQRRRVRGGVHGARRQIRHPHSPVHASAGLLQLDRHVHVPAPHVHRVREHDTEDGTVGVVLP